MEVRDNLSEDEASELAISLSNSDHTVDAFKNKDGTYRISWIKNKKYTAYDGKEFTDEVWTTEDYRMICVQDLTEAHAKNIIRMMMRNDRMMLELTHELMEKVGGMAELLQPTESDRVLH